MIATPHLKQVDLVRVRGRMQVEHVGPPHPNPGSNMWALLTPILGRTCGPSSPQSWVEYVGPPHPNPGSNMWALLTPILGRTCGPSSPQSWVDALQRLALVFVSYICRALKKKLTVPTLLLWAEHDMALGPQLLRGTEQHLETLEVHIVPAASHWLQQDRPEEVNGLMQRFLRGQRV
jgi:hypothetical protein